MFLPSSAQQPAESNGKRIALFDNLKGLLVILVVFGHMMHPIHNDNPALSTAFDIIYLFHMPLFVLISGLFAKSTFKHGKLNINRVISFFLLGVIFQATLIAVNGKSLTLASLVRFPSAPWYLIAMGWWSAATPILHRLGPLHGIIASTVLCFAGGLLDLEGGFLATSRTIAFLPWFALGYYLSPRTVASIRTHRVAWIAVAASALLIITRAMDSDSFEWFFPMVYGDTPYDTSFVLGLMQKAVAMAAGGVMSIALIKLTPSSHSWLTILGERTLQVYILHRIIRAALTFRTPFYEAGALLDPLTGTFTVALLTVLAIALCCSSKLEKAFNGFLRMDWRTLHRAVVTRSRLNRQFDIERYIQSALKSKNRLTVE